jgi:ketosteroid isomerase-like protein
MPEGLERNTQVVRKAFDAFTRRDVEAFVRIMDPEVELYVPVTAELAGEPVPYRGHDGIRRYFEHVKMVWERLEVFLHEYHDLGDRVMVVGRVRAQGRNGRIEDTPAHWVWQIEDGRITAGHVYTDRKQALEAAGLSAEQSS